MKISTLALICLLFGAGSCAREDNVQSGGKLLKVDVQMAASSPMPTPMLTRGATASPIVSDTVDMGNDLVLVATSQPRQAEEALTRGTPIHSAAKLPSMNVKVYNSGTGSFSGATALATTLKGTNASGAWSLSPPYMIVGGEKNTYMAYSPIEDANNGIVVAANGRTLTYTAPPAAVNHPDLCSAAIIKDDASSNLSLAMQHRLVAVGIKVSADNVTINEISLNNVRPSGTLNLETGVWGDLPPVSSFLPTLTTTTPGTGGEMNDITAARGYLMLPPQTFTADDRVLRVSYTYAGGTRQLATVKLKDLTGGKWEAGQLVMYEIQLKAKFSLTFSPASLTTLPLSAGTASFTYSTNSPSAGDPQFTNKDGVAWITNLSVNRSTKTVTFNYAENTLPSARTAAIKATSGWTEKEISIKQLSDPDLGSYIPRSVLAAAGWPTDRLPKKGLQMAVRGNFLPGSTTATQYDKNVVWSTENSTITTDHKLGSGKASYAILATKDAAVYPIGQVCKHLGSEWYVPSTNELLLIAPHDKDGKLLWENYTFAQVTYWASDQFDRWSGSFVFFDRKHTAGCYNGRKYKYESYAVRCVREI